MRALWIVSTSSCLLLAAGCTDSRLVDVAPRVPMHRGWSQGRGLTGPEARALVAQEAHRRAALGDRSMLEQLARDSALPPGITAAEAMTSTDPEDPSTWGKTTILSPLVIASIGDYQYVYASMLHDGHFGHIDLSWTLRSSGGSSLAGGSERFTDWQPLAWPGQFSKFSASIPLNLGHSCGRTLTGTAAFTSYWGPLPEVRISRFTIPSYRYGLTSMAAVDSDAEPPCQEDPPPDGGGTTTGDTNAGADTDGSTTYVQEMCLYYDWYYPDGTHWFTETVECWLVYTTVNDT